jgi:hypothetical protein
VGWILAATGLVEAVAFATYQARIYQVGRRA